MGLLPTSTVQDKRRSSLKNMAEQLISSKQETLSSDQLQIALLNDISKKLSKLIGLQGKIYAEHLNEADSGEYLEFEKTASTIEETYYTKEYISHYIRSYSIENTGASDIVFGHNSFKSKRYNTVSPGEEREFAYNRKVIRDIYVKTSSGTSTYVLTLMW